MSIIAADCIVGLDKVTITVSFASSRESSTILPIVMVADVDPALIVSVPLAKCNQFLIQSPFL